MGKDSDRRKTPIVWEKYNKKLVGQGKNTANFIDELKKMEPTWKEELKEMNKEKLGKPYEYANSLIMLLAILKFLTLKGYRFTEGFAHLFLIICPTYSAIQKRVARFDLDILKGMNKETLEGIGKDKVIRVIKDGTGIQINGRYVWIDKRFNLKRKRKWKKLDMTIELKTLAILSLNVLPEAANEGEEKEFRKSMDEAKDNLPGDTRIGTMFGDGGFDSNSNFEYCEKNGIEPIIRIRKPTCKRIKRKEKIKKGMLWTNRYLIIEKSSVRDRYAEEQTDWKTFVETKRYGLRGGIEGFNGSFKGFYGERTHSKIDRNIEIEFFFKQILWNRKVLGKR